MNEHSSGMSLSANTAVNQSITAIGFPAYPDGQGNTATTIRRKRIERQNQHRDIFIDYMQLSFLEQNLKKLIQQFKVKEHEIIKTRDDLSKSKSMFGQFLKRIHDLSEFRRVEHKRTEFKTEKESALIECNQIQSLLEIEIKELEKEADSLDKYRVFVDEVKKDIPGTDQLSNEEFFTSPEFGVEAIHTLLENFEYRQVSQMSLYEREEEERTKRETAFEEELKSLQRNQAKVAESLKISEEISEELQMNKMVLTEHLKKVERRSQARLAVIEKEEKALSSKIEEMFQDVFPKKTKKNINTMEKLKMMEMEIFDILDVIEQCPKKNKIELHKLIEHKTTIRLYEARKKQQSLEWKQRDEKKQTFHERAMAPPFVTQGKKRPMFRSYLPHNLECRKDVRKLKDIEDFGIADEDEKYNTELLTKKKRNSKKHEKLDSICLRTRNNDKPIANKMGLLLMDSTRTLNAINQECFSKSDSSISKVSKTKNVTIKRSDNTTFNSNGHRIRSSSSKYK